MSLNYKNPFRLLRGRLGVYEKPFNTTLNPIEGVTDLSVRLKQQGGNEQQERMIKDKRRSLDRALRYSYQGAEVVKTDASERKPVRALINPDKLSQDYDNKIISVGYEYDFTVGTVFEWIGTNTFWLVYLQDLTELAYFRGNIKKCSHEIAWIDADGQHHITYAAIRGPVETRINNIQKHDIVVDVPNYSLNILIPKNEFTLDYFKRYSKFYLQNNTTCWRVEAVDSISTPGILEVVAVEYYSNEMEDDIQAGVVGGLIEVKPSEEEKSQIKGESFIKIKKPYKYVFDGTEALNWHVDEKYPVELSLDLHDPRNVIITWLEGYSGQFDLYYGDYKKTIVVESLF